MNDVSYNHTASPNFNARLWSDYDPRFFARGIHFYNRRCDLSPRYTGKPLYLQDTRWVYGYPFYLKASVANPEASYIIDDLIRRDVIGEAEFRSWPVLNGSICSFSGFFDSKNTSIFEGDKVLLNNDLSAEGVIEHAGNFWVVKSTNAGDTPRTNEPFLLGDIPREFILVTGSIFDDKLGKGVPQ